METKTYGVCTKLTDGPLPQGVLSLKVDGIPTSGILHEHVPGHPFIMEILGNIYNVDDFHRIEWLDEQEGVLLTKERYEALMESIEVANKIISQSELKHRSTYDDIDDAVRQIS